MIRKTVRVVGMLLLTAIIAAPARGEFQLASNERVVLLGDTALVGQRAMEPFIQFVRTRYPDCCPLVCSLGKMRSTPGQAMTRLVSEVFPLEPTRVMLCFGLEGGPKDPFDQAKQDAAIADLKKLALAVREHGVKVEFLTPPPPDDGRSRGLKRVKYRNTVASYADAVRQLARELDAPVADWNAAADEYRKIYAGKITPGWTRNGIIPDWYMYVILADVLLEHWQAEPLDYLITVDWAEGGEASANMGKARIADRSSKFINVALEGVPVVVNMLGGQKMPENNWPLSKWFHYRLKLEHAPKHGVVISQDGEHPQSYGEKEISAGADISTSGPLAYHDATRALHNAILSSCNQFSQYFMASERNAPEPELEKGFQMMHEAEKELLLGAHKIACRTPSRFDVTIRIEEALAALHRDAEQKKDEKRPAGKPPRTRPRRK